MKTTSADIKKNKASFQALKSCNSHTRISTGFDGHNVLDYIQCFFFSCCITREATSDSLALLSPI